MARKAQSARASSLRKQISDLTKSNLELGDRLVDKSDELAEALAQIALLRDDLEEERRGAADAKETAIRRLGYIDRVREMDRQVPAAAAPMATSVGTAGLDLGPTDQVPAFEIKTNKGHYKIWANGRAEGFGPATVVNRIPQLIAKIGSGILKDSRYGR